jgi:hypothetical protein
MQFDSSNAWREAVAKVQANQEVLFALAGVFFLLPGLASVLLFADVQQQLYVIMGNRAQMEKFVQSGALNPVAIFGLAAFVLQLVGYLAMLSILTDRGRPTVAEALRSAARALPTAIATTVLLFLAVIAGMMVFGAIAGVIGRVAEPLAFVILGIFVGLLVSGLVRLSLILPVIAADMLSNPIAVVQRSMKLTKGNTGRLLLFYAVLFIVYFVILLLVGAVAGVFTFLLAGQGIVSILVSGVISGIVGALASVLLTAILAAVHRQLAEPSSTALGATFE